MKMIIAVIFLGILMHAFAKSCELMPAVKNFDSERYFKNPHMYVTHSKNGPKEKVCQEHEVIQKRPTFIKTFVLNVYNAGGKEHKILMDCINKPKNGKPGQFDVECEVRESGNKIQLETSVIATDYQNYAFLQSCSKADNTENILVFEGNEKNVYPAVNSVFKAKKWSSDEWFSRKNVNCDDVKK
uniref:Putative triabin n=1 Tax=Panstrongylus megistus TaxID=65343 RepID=A0A069DNX1_9HEMI